ncbi:hypothetical protein IJM86_01110 [bacterium]|nr:hypothetical protein [bacterium]
MSILLPSFSFQTIKVDLPQLPDLPQMPDIGLDLSNINLADFQKKLKLIYKLTPFIINSDISIPELPAPPTLPELPSFIPNVDIELPLLPPAPAIPKLPSKFESILSAFEKIGKIYCKVKQNLGLVAEGSLKAKVEQLTQRTYEVPRFDNIIDLTDKLRLEAKNSAPVGFDIEIASHVNLQIDSSIIYAFLDGVAKNLNQISYKVKDDLNKKSQELSNKASEATYQMQDWTDEKTAELLEQASKPINETIDKTQQSLAPLTEPIDKAQQKLQEGMDKENQK